MTERGVVEVQGSVALEGECEHCGRTFTVVSSVGRPRKYCRRSCRQRAFEARRHQGDLDWGERRVVRLTAELAELEDRVDAARVVVEELRADLDDGRPPHLEAALSRLKDALSGDT